MSTPQSINVWVFGLTMVAIGVTHFTHLEFFLKAMPPYLPWHRELVWISGVGEMAIGLGMLWGPTRWYAAWGAVALFVAVFPANIHIYRHQELFPIPPVLHLIRLPMQALFILWAYSLRNLGR